MRSRNLSSVIGALLRGRSDRNVIEIGRDLAVRERLRRLCQDVLVWIASRNVSKHQLLDTAFGRERRGLPCSKMAVVARDGRIAIQKGGLDHQHVGVANVLVQAFGGFRVADHDKLLASLWRSEN